MVRDTKTLDELIESTRDASTSPEQLRAQRRPFAATQPSRTTSMSRAKSLRARTPTWSGFSARND